MLGRDILALLHREREQAHGLARADLDVTDATAVRDVFRRLRPEVVVNCAAWTAVDDAESHENRALAVNGNGPANLAEVCAASGAHLFHFSTDYVFGGTAREPYQEDAVPDPRTAYGRTKLAGEQAVLGRLPRTGYVVRTAWLYGGQGPNFVRTMIRLERERHGVDVVDDQHGQPTWTVDVAAQIVALMRSDPAPGVYHATSSGQTTWCGLAREVFRMLSADPERVRAVASGALDRPAHRPAYSVLGHARWAGTGIAPIPDWRLSLRRAFPALVAAEPDSATRPGAATADWGHAS
jgi:dTDP-4-dehydrorhamnose reductase